MWSTEMSRSAKGSCADTPRSSHRNTKRARARQRIPYTSKRLGCGFPNRFPQVASGVPWTAYSATLRRINWADQDAAWTSRNACRLVPDVSSHRFVCALACQHNFESCGGDLLGQQQRQALAVSINGPSAARTTEGSASRMSRADGTSVCSWPTRAPRFAASAASHRACPSNPTVKECSGCSGRSRLAVASTSEESGPPDKYVATGPSDAKRRDTAESTIWVSSSVSLSVRLCAPHLRWEVEIPVAKCCDVA